MEIRGSISPGFRGAADIVHHDRLTRDARYANINKVHSKAARVLEEVVFSPAQRLPGFSIIDTNLEGSDRDVRVDDLYAEPVFRGASLGFQEQRTADIALDDLPLHVDTADFEVC